MRKLLYCLAYCLGSVLYGLVSAGTGALIPIKADSLNIPETDFSSTMAFRGIGGVVGAFIGIFIEKYLSMHTTMGLCFILMGTCSFVAGIADNLSLFTMAFCIVELSGILSMICSNVSILRIYEAKHKNEAWVKGIYLSFAIGAFLTPIMVNFLGVLAYEIYPVIAVIVVLFMFLTKEPKQASILVVG